MAVRVRETGEIVCAAKHSAMPGDLYLDDSIQALLIGLGVTVTEDGGGTWTIADPRQWSATPPQDVTILRKERAHLIDRLAEARKDIEARIDNKHGILDELDIERELREKAQEDYARSYLRAEKAEREHLELLESFQQGGVQVASLAASDLATLRRGVLEEVEKLEGFIRYLYEHKLGPLAPDMEIIVDKLRDLVGDGEVEEKGEEAGK